MALAEVCIGGIDDALAAEKGGADRVELCAGLLEGGLTPSIGTVEQVLNDVSIPVVVLVRPRGGDFCYSGPEMDVLLRDIRALKELGVYGIATGVLTADGAVDRDAMSRIQEAAGHLSLTCHRAFDMTRDPWEALEALLDMGVPRVLTSGQEASVVEGTPLIRKLVDASRGRMSIMPGGGVRTGNVAPLLLETGATEVHFTAFADVESPMKHRNPRPRMGGKRVPGEFEKRATDPERVRSYIDAIRGSD